MCGFVGFTNHIDNSNVVLGEMLDKIKHRGPDAEGTYIDEDIALGHRRLSIIDVSEAGTQPLYSEDGNLALLFNGEIYNYQEIRARLIEAGYHFATQTDSEVLIYGYQEYGADLLQQLRGMFSFVIWDKREKKLFGARDFFGIKPMYYAQMGETFLFGSEIKSFLCHPHFKKVLNTAALENYLTFQYSPCDETFFQGVYKLPPAHYFTYQDGKFTMKRYWDVHFKADQKPDLDTWVNRISDTFHDSVEAHKIADVEVGSFLSSGVDSSYVAAIANVDKTFTVGFGTEERYNEIGWAKGFSEAIGKKNYNKVITPEEYWEKLPMIQYHMDEPLADPAAIALYFVCNLASQSLKVVLSGEGADEVFGGYLYFHKAPDAKAFHEETVRKLGKLYLYDCLRANKSLAAWGIEGRVPFLDKEFLDVAMGMNPVLKMCPDKTIEKKVVREAFADLLPEEVAWRQKEQFSDGVGYSWIDTLKQITASAVSDEQMAHAAERFPINPPQNKEEYYYRSIFAEHFPSDSAAKSVPSVPSVACSTAEALAWDASFKNQNDPSGRAVAGVHEQAYK